MGLPETVRVKLSSEAAGAISLTPVVVQELPIRELVEHVLGVAGKDEGRLREILLRGTLVSGGSRFRWSGWEVDVSSLQALLATFPDPDPSRKCSPQHCFRVVLRGGRNLVEVPREAASGRSLFRRTTFWDVLMEELAGATPSYSGYSYRERADRYVIDLTLAASERLRAAAKTIRYTGLRDRVCSLPVTQVEIFVTRAG